MLARNVSRLITILAFVAASTALSCGGCNDETSRGTNNSAEADGGNATTPVGCADNDGDGYSAGLTCDGQVDCDDTDAMVNPEADETCFDDVDNNCDGAVDEGCGDCREGETRDCGAEFGACELGTQTCRNGVWSGCENAVLPSPEQCNGLDDDCDGMVDENGDAICNDNKVCNGVETCSMGACQAGEPLDCSNLDGTCMTGACSEKDGGCRLYPVDDDTPCDDGLYCTIDGTCQAGECVSQARDCSDQADQCNNGVCDESIDSCVAQPVGDGTGCDDGAYCTVNDVCTDGVCGGGSRDCSAEADQCNTGVCNEASDQCEPTPRVDGTSCDDGAYCNVGEACLAGVCTGGSMRQCGASGGSCREGVCDEANDTCTGDPVPNGTVCDDGLYCTSGDACVDGTCVGPVPTDCSAEDDDCNVGQCNESLNECVKAPVPNTTQCNDDLYCTVSDICTDGVCGGAPRDCSTEDDACNVGRCDEANNTCGKRPLSDGTGCPDGIFCTANETCVGGTCTTTVRDCSSQDSECAVGTCDMTLDRCVAAPVMDGTPCEDGFFCTSGDSCMSGICSGGGPTDCSGETMGDNCLIAQCSEAQQCYAINDPTCCDVMTDADVDGFNECDDCNDTNGSVFPGATERCNGVDDDCDGLIDEDFDNDMDTFSVCATDPLLFDCDDNAANVNPGAPENCGPDGTGNSIDDNCNGYVDEGCNPCDPNDTDGDGVSECAGDCAPNDGSVYPGAAEQCDGIDNDCNTYTRANCGVSDPCNFDGDNDPSNEADICRDDQICACEVNGSGSCTGAYLCTSFCNSSATGTPGDSSDGCTASQTCQYDLLRSANVHGCAETTTIPGTLSGGQACGSDDQCRSLSCDKICVGPGCNQKYCTDWCGSDAYCPTSGAVCRLSRTSANIDGRCWPSSNSLVGSTPTGSSCSTDRDCVNGFCTADGSSNYCTEACCQDSDCPSGYGCRLDGDAIDTSYVFNDPNAASCTADSQCPGGICFNNVCAWRLVETSPMCIRDETAQGSRVAGQACSSNSQCESNFCERTLGVCVSPCCDDSTCPTGLSCEFQRVQTTNDRITSARICTNLPQEGIYRRM